MAAGKWIDGLTAATPLADAARHALTVRLEVVRDYLPLALHHADDDPEHVHQLRVGTRRARAALDIFAVCLPSKAQRAARRHLRGVRRAAGEARDWDVFLITLSAWGQRQKEPHRAGLDFLTGYGEGRRAAAQGELEAAVAGYPFDFDRLLADTVAAVRKPDDPSLRTLGDLARPLLAGLLKELDEAAGRDLDDYEHLHRVRILGKRLRYAMEVFAGCYAPPFREQLYPAVEEMQEVLGRANDSHVASERLEALRARLRRARPDDWKRYRLGVEGLLRYHRRQVPLERRRFLAWWQRWQAHGAEAALTSLLLT
jgi:CHAD domain-containing protein